MGGTWSHITCIGCVFTPRLRLHVLTLMSATISLSRPSCIASVAATHEPREIASCRRRSLPTYRTVQHIALTHRCRQTYGAPVCLSVCHDDAVEAHHTTSHHITSHHITSLCIIPTEGMHQPLLSRQLPCRGCHALLVCRVVV
jgi:hypothetical protein